MAGAPDRSQRQPPARHTTTACSHILTGSASASACRQGVVWSVARFSRRSQLYSSICCRGGQSGGFINLQQFTPNLSVDRSGASCIDLRWPTSGWLDSATTSALTIETPDAASLHAVCRRLRRRSFVAAQMVGANSPGKYSRQFLIAESGDGAFRRRCSVDPPFHAPSALCTSAGHIWRIDCNCIRMRSYRKRPENGGRIAPSRTTSSISNGFAVQFHAGDEQVLHGRVSLPAMRHQVSPFGPRPIGLRAENVAWKLDRVFAGTSPETLLESYHTTKCCGRRTSANRPVDRFHGAARTGAGCASGCRREETEFGKRMVNGGRCGALVYDTPLSTTDAMRARRPARALDPMADCAATASRCSDELSSEGRFTVRFGMAGVDAARCETIVLAVRAPCRCKALQQPVRPNRTSILRPMAMSRAVPDPSGADAR